MILAKKTFWMVAGLLASAVAVRAEPTSSARIISVVSTTEIATVAAQGLNNINGRQMTKFLDQMERARDVFRVSWSTAAGGWSGRTEVQLAYRTQASKSVQGEIQRYEETRPGRHVSTFAIPTGHAISAWRVRLVQNGKTLDEKSSGSWK